MKCLKFIAKKPEKSALKALCSRNIELWKQFCGYRNNKMYVFDFDLANIQPYEDWKGLYNTLNQYVTKVE